MQLTVTQNGIRYLIDPVLFFGVESGEIDLWGFRQNLAGHDFADMAQFDGSGVTVFPNQSDVSPSLKERFNDWIDARTAVGIAKYGQPLQTDNGRNAEQDAFEELLDFCQYQQQSRMELKAEVKQLRGILEAILSADERGQGLPFAEAMEAARVAVSENGSD